MKNRNYINHPIIFITALAMMSMIGLFSSDVYLPSMPAIVNYFKVEYGVVQNTISIYLLGLAIFQIIYGPLSDHFGRKPILVWGTIIYILASIGCTVSPSIHWLMLCRFVQATGACAGILMGKCIITDIFDSKAATKIFTIVLPIVAASPAIAPVIGGYIQQYYNWRVVFIVPVAFGIILLWLILQFIGETNPHKNKLAQIHHLLNGYKLLFKNKIFLCYSIIVALVYCSWFAYLSNSSYIYNNFGLNPQQIGYCYITQSIASIIGSLLARKLVTQHVPVQRLIIIALCMNLFGCVALGIYGVYSVWLFIFTITICAFTNGILLPLNISSAMSSAVNNNSKVGGSASGLVGFLQIGGGAVGVFITSYFTHNVVTLSIILAVFMLLSIITFCVKESHIGGIK
ncbi:MAG: multidrug effflux MFS transporter [Burkholderiales bacterium]|nr:multidrug effflux MFS transporter [Burkholderiales bacterium]